MIISSLLNRYSILFPFKINIVVQNKHSTRMFPGSNEHNKPNLSRKTGPRYTSKIDVFYSRYI